MVIIANPPMEIRSPTTFPELIKLSTEWKFAAQNISKKTYINGFDFV
ncbi:MAG: hypothetical protein PWP15_779 [Methanothermococcus sp.]|nr:hypothetical protein [Methanothermococcus sp.]